MEEKQISRNNANPSFKSMMHRMNRGKNPDDDTSMGEETTDSEQDYQENGWTDDVEFEDELTDETELDKEMQIEKNQEQDASGIAVFGKKNDFTRASSLLKATMATKNRIEKPHELEGTNRTNREEQGYTEQKDITNHELEGINRTEMRVIGHTESQQEEDTINGLDGITGNKEKGHERLVQTRDEGGGNARKSANSKNLGISSGRNAREIFLESGTLQVGPMPKDEAASPEAPTQKLFRYNVQLSFSKPLKNEAEKTKQGRSNYHVPSHFKQVVKQLNKFSPAIILQPYNTNGVPITSADQLPDDEIEEYIIYYHNHHVTANGQLIGMCCIEAPYTWSQLKDERKTLFKWLRDNGVFMKYVSFKADQVSAAGWFYGMPPDVLRTDEAVKELRERLGQRLPPDLHIQLGVRMLSITDKVSRNRFSFKGVAVECDRTRVRELQEILYQMENPKEARFTYGITGKAFFVPFVESEAWPNSKILGIAKAHVQEMSKLGQLFLQNVKDIDQPLIWEEGDEESLRVMLTNCTTIDGCHMIHSVHNTNRVGTITLLYYKEFKQEANSCFQDIQEILENQLSEESKKNIAIEGKKIIMTGSRNQVESSDNSREYSSYADIILAGMNPQGGEEEEEEEILVRSPPRKKQAQRRSPPRMTYSQAATKTKRNRNEQTAKGNTSTTVEGDFTMSSDSEDTITAEASNPSMVINKLQEQLDRMQAQFEEQFGKVEGTDTETTKRLIEENNKEIQRQSEAFFEKKFQELSVSLSMEIQRSNELILEKFAAMNAQQNTTLLTLQGAVKQELLKIYANMANLQAGKPMENLPQTIGIVAMPGRDQQASDGEK